MTSFLTGFFTLFALTFNLAEPTSVRAIPFEVFVQVNDTIVYHGPAYFVNEHMIGASTHPQVFVATDRQLVVLDIPPASEVVITTKPPTQQSMIPLGHFGLRLSSNGANLYSGEPWELHIQREAHDTGIAAQVVDSTSHTFKLDQGDEIVARSFFP